jgi:branched-subunit amino acid transport protein AzlD
MYMSIIKKKIIPFGCLISGTLLFIEGLFINYAWSDIGIPSIVIGSIHLHHWMYGLMILSIGAGTYFKFNYS